MRKFNFSTVPDQTRADENMVEEHNLLLQGGRPLRPDDLSIFELYSTEDDCFTFCLDVIADEEAVFGRKLSSEQEGSYIMTYLLVFEAPIDMLSFISLHHDSNWAKHSYVALCGTSSQPLLGMLERYPDIEAVHLCLDNDQAGQLATKRLAKVVREKGLTVDARVPVLKDWNEDLCSNFQQTMEEQQHEQSVS